MLSVCVCLLCRPSLLRFTGEPSIRGSAIGESVGDTEVRQSACYLRPDDTRQLVESEELEHALQADDALFSWSEITPALVINRPSAMGSNSSKPYQLELIRQLGFLTRDTLVTTDPAEVIRFWKFHGEIVYKSISGVRSIVSRFVEAQLPRLQHLTTCPTQFQPCLSGCHTRPPDIVARDFAA